MKKIFLWITFLACLTLFSSCAAWSSHINLPEAPTVEIQNQTHEVCVLVSRFGATTLPDKELVPQLLAELPQVLREQHGFSDIRLESEGKCPSIKRTILIKGLIRNANNAAVPTPIMTTINFTHSSEVEFAVYDVTDLEPAKRFDENLQADIFIFDITSAKKLLSGLASTTTKADYGAQANVPKFVRSVLEIAAKDLSIQIANQMYEQIQ